MLKRIFPFLVFLLLLNSCTSEFKPTIFETTYIDTKYDVEVSASYDKAIGGNTLSKTINTNIERKIINTLDAGENKTNLNTVLKDFNSEYLNFKKDFPNDSDPVWELGLETELIYQSEEILTFAISTYEFKGGAHGSDKINFLNLNAKTGEVLSLNDIIENKGDFKVLAQKYFINSQANEKSKQKMEDFFFGKPFKLPENIGFSEDGLVLLYNVYEVASYDLGYTEFVIPFEELKSFLKVN